MSAITSDGFDIAGDIINDAAVELGLAEVDDPFASDDQNFILLCRLLKSVGRDLCRRRAWSILLREDNITLVSGTGTYALPSGFRSMVDQSGWNRTSRLPLGGPLSPQEWQYFSAIQPGLTFLVMFRPRGNYIEVFGGSSIPNGHVLYYQYISDYWVQRPPDDSLATVDDTVHLPGSTDPSDSDDNCLLDPLMLMRGLKLAWLKAKGFDTSAAQADFDDAYAMAAANDQQAPILSLSNRAGMEPLISTANAPITGFGS